MLKLKQLKQRVYDMWAFAVESRDALVQPALFKSEIRSRFGDLRRKATWESALCYYHSSILIDTCAYASVLLTKHLNVPADSDLFYLRDRLVSTFLTFPEGLELVKFGLEQLFNESPQDGQKVLAVLGWRQPAATGSAIVPDSRRTASRTQQSAA